MKTPDHGAFAKLPRTEGGADFTDAVFAFVKISTKAVGTENRSN